MLDLNRIQQDAQEFIVGHVEKHWRDTETALLLSQLGKPLKETISGSEYLLRNGLKQLLVEWPIVQLVHHPVISEKIGLVPLGTQLPADLSELFRKRPKSAESTSDFRYSQRFWRSFYTPITGNRFVVVERDGFEILDEYSGPIGSNYFEVYQDDLVDSNIPYGYDERIEKTHATIAAWLIRNGLDRQSFSGETTERRSHHKNDFIEDLHRLFGALGDDDRARISLPLDIVMKLLARS